MNRQWRPDSRRRPPSPYLVGGSLLALLGVGQVLTGYAAAADGWFVFSGSGHWYRADDTVWGTVNLMLGAGAVGLGAALAVAAHRLRRPGALAAPALVVAAASLMSQCLLVAQYPLWSSLVIAVAVFAVWALATGPVPVRSDEDDRITGLGTPHGCDWDR